MLIIFVQAYIIIYHLIALFFFRDMLQFPFFLAQFSCEFYIEIFRVASEIKIA